MRIFMYLFPDSKPCLDEDVGDSVRRVLSRMVLPRVITGEVVSRYVRKALRLGVWGRLAPETRALLLVCRRLARPVKSRVLAEILSETFLRIELAGLRGKALFYGVVEFVRRGLGSIEDALRSVGRVLCLGISYLNNPPPILRPYG